MNALDITICVIGAYCLVRGLFRGIIKEVTSIVGVFIAFYGAYSYYPIVSGWFSTVVSNTAYLAVISFVVVFSVILLFVGAVGVILKNVFKAAALGWADRILGGTFAVVKAILIVSVLLIAFTALLPKNAPLLQHSRLTPHVIATAETFVAAVPTDMKTQFRDKIKALKESW
jgi:membrane protein required for colicin V production